MNAEINDPQVVDDIINRWCNSLLKQVNAHVDALRAAVSCWEPRPCPPKPDHGRSPRSWVR